MGQEGIHISITILFSAVILGAIFLIGLIIAVMLFVFA